MTPFENAQTLAKSIKMSIEVMHALEEIEQLSPEQRDTPETRAVIEVLAFALSHLMVGEIAEA
tara:strand:+ start:670 stop:858 length:189 start_codon:yes stop_codon:yes gene_type:complete